MIRVRSFISGSKGSVLGALIIAVAALGVSYLTVGSPLAALSYLRGERVIVSPRTCDLGVGDDQQQLTARFQVRNLSGKPLIITGANTNCTCIVAGQYPVQILPGGIHELAFLVKLSHREPVLSQKVMLYTDARDQPSILLRIKGRVTPLRPR